MSWIIKATNDIEFTVNADPPRFFRLDMNLQNAAFEYAEEAVSDILKDIARDVRQGIGGNTILDANGKTVGGWGFDR